MADEVVIRLQAQSAQLEASLTRLEKSLLRLENRSRRTNTAMQTGARRTSKSINEQNKSFTLMVAKLALVAFAVQTLANIFQNTFGAVLKDIDDFQIAAIGAAAAVTNIAADDRDIGEVFNQNLEAALVVFEKLELVAARFFSTGQELQLAFNTLAQRGVVIREEEFDILGKLVDQIKLLTGGQNAQIQIQQELRAILDGNVRTTTAFGKSLQARGVDITQLSRELRATGSIKVFEQFLTGLDAAGGAIRRTLTSVLTTFKSLISILSRNIFQDTYDGVVKRITQVNNFLIDQRDLLVTVGKVVVENIQAGLKRVVGFMEQWANILGDIVADDFLKLLAILSVIGRLTSGPVRVFLILGVVLQAITGDIKDVDKAFNILIGTMRIVLRLLGQIIEESLTGFQQLARKINFGIAQNSIQELEQEIKGLQNLLASPGNFKGLFSPDREETVKRLTEATKELALANDTLFEEAAKSIALETRLRIELLESLERQGILSDKGRKELEKLRSFISKIPIGLVDTGISGQLTEIEKQVEGLLESLGLTPATERLKEFFESFKAQLKGLGDAKFTPTGIITESDNALERQEIKGLNKIADAQRATQEKARKQAVSQELSEIRSLAAERKITGLQAFEQTRDLRKQSLKDNIAEFEIQEKLIRERGENERRAIKTAAAADEGPTKLTENEKLLKLNKQRTDEAIKLRAVTDKIAAVQSQIAKESVDAARKVTKETEKVNRLLAKRKLENDQLIAQTSGDRAAGIQLGSDIAKQNFASDNLGDTQAITTFNEQQDERDFAAVAAPQIAAFKKAIDDVFAALIDGIVEGSFEFRDLAQSISKDLIKSGMEDLIANTKKIVIGGIEDMFEGIGIAASGKAAQALALGIGLMLAVLSRLGNDGEFTSSGASGGSGIQSSRQVRGIIGGDTAIPIAEINNGLMEALIPTQALLSQIERNTRGTAAAALDLDPAALQDALNNSLNQIFQQAVLQNGP